MLLIRFSCNLFMGWNIRGLTMDGVQQIFHNQGLGYTRTLSALKLCIEWKGNRRTIYVLFLRVTRKMISDVDKIAYSDNVRIYWKKKARVMQISVENGQWTT